MKNNINIFSDMLAIMRIPNIAIDDFNISETINILQPPPIIEGVILGKRLNLISFPD
ncbi:hypothetical protein D3C78_1483550 [compost metagenome]